MFRVQRAECVRQSRKIIEREQKKSLTVKIDENKIVHTCEVS